MIWKIFPKYMSFIEFLAKRRKCKEDVFYVTFMPPWRHLTSQANDIKEVLTGRQPNFSFSFLIIIFCLLLQIYVNFISFLLDKEAEVLCTWAFFLLISSNDLSKDYGNGGIFFIVFWSWELFFSGGCYCICVRVEWMCSYTFSQQLSLFVSYSIFVY